MTYNFLFATFIHVHAGHVQEIELIRLIKHMSASLYIPFEHVAHFVSSSYQEVATVDAHK
jgi:hypothetical protein